MKTSLVVLSLFVLSSVAHASDPWIGLVLERGSQGGTRVREVMEGAPGQKAGIKAGDEVLALDAEKTDSVQVLIGAVRRAGVGKTIKLKISDAAGKLRVVAIKLEAKPDMNVLQRDTLVGKAAPDFQPAVLTGAELGKLSSLKGQVVLIAFFATWCRPCVAMMPHIEALHERLGQKGLKVIGISSESAEVVATVAEKFNLKYTIASDDSEVVSSSYRIYALPTMVVIDRQGVVREVSVADPDAVDAAVTAAMAK